MIEVLVVVGITALLLALALPAVQSAREASRKLHCAANLRQIGLALHGYAETHQWFPSVLSSELTFRVPLLPYLDGTQIYEQMNFDISPMDLSNAHLAAHQTVKTRVVSQFLCPSDGAGGSLLSGLETWGTGANYFANFGHRDHSKHTNGFFPYTDTTYFRPSRITRGLARTAAISEVLISNQSSDRRRKLFIVEPYLPFSTHGVEPFASACQNAAGARTLPAQRGRPWCCQVFVHNVCYNHVLPPNANSCLNSSHFLEGASSGSSQHHEGVHVAFGDGHVEFIANDVALEVWRAMGRRSE